MIISFSVVLVVNAAKAEFKKVMKWTNVVNEHRVRIENLHEEMALNLKELKEKIRVAREEANNVRFCKLKFNGSPLNFCDSYF